MDSEKSTLLAFKHKYISDLSQQLLISMASNDQVLNSKVEPYKVVNLSIELASKLYNDLTNRCFLNYPS